MLQLQTKQLILFQFLLRFPILRYASMSYVMVINYNVVY